MLEAKNIFLGDPKHKRNPYPMHAQMPPESTGRPVRRRFDLIWRVTRYDCMRTMLTDGRLANDTRNVPGRKNPLQFALLAALFKPLIYHILSSDPPDHTRLRSLAQKAFTAKRVEALRARVESLTEEVLAHTLKQRNFDLV